MKRISISITDKKKYYENFSNDIFKLERKDISIEKIKEESFQRKYYKYMKLNLNISGFKWFIRFTARTLQKTKS